MTTRAEELRRAEHDRKARERRQYINDEKELQAEEARAIHKKKEQQKSLREEIDRQLQVKKQRQAEVSNVSANASSVGPSAERVERGILLRCPVTGKLLPPEQFNVPVSHHTWFRETRID